MSNQKSEDVLADAVARNSAIVFSLPSAGMLRHHKSRFLALTDEGIWIEGIKTDFALLSDLIQSGERAGVSFRTSTRMINFSTAVLCKNPDFQMNKDLTVEAILLRPPPQIDSQQRRNNYRVGVPEGSDLVSRIWRISEHHVLRDRPMASLEIPHQITDLSAGGMGVRLLPRGDEPVKATCDERLRVEVTYQSETIIVEGRLRLPNGFDPQGKCRAGIAFKKLESDLEGRQAIALLTRIAGDLQRDEVRQRKLGFRKAG